MGIEIERKFLVDHEKWRGVAKPAGTHFRQGYLLDDAKRTIRIRATDDRAFITIKGTTTGISRKEFEYPIPLDDATAMLDAFAESEVDKVRYCIDFNGNLWEVDVFEGKNSGLIMAEIELDDENQVFSKPEWITDEVSHDVRYYNSNLSKDPFKNWGI